MAENNAKLYFEGYGLKIIETKPRFYDVYDAKWGGRLKFTIQDITGKDIDNYINQTVNIRKKNKQRRDGEYYGKTYNQ